MRAPSFVRASGLLTVVAMGLMGGAARAELIAYDPFDAVPGLPVLGQDGGVGFAGPWEPGGFNAGDNLSYVVQPGSLSYPGLATSANHAETGANQTMLQGVTRTFNSPLDATNSTIYLSVLLRPDGVLNEGAFNGYFGLYLNGGLSNDLQDDLFIGKPGADAINDYVVEHRGGFGQVSSGVNAVVGETALLVLRADFQAGNDRFTLYVNPTVGAGEPSSGAVKIDLDLFNVTGLTLYSTGAHAVDEIRVGTTYADVVPPAGRPGEAVPLPAAVWGGLALMGGVGASRWRRARLRAS